MLHRVLDPQVHKNVFLKKGLLDDVSAPVRQVRTLINVSTMNDSDDVILRKKNRVAMRYFALEDRRRIDNKTKGFVHSLTDA